MLVDANIFLEFFLDKKKAVDCVSFLKRVQSGEERAVISTFTIDGISLVLEREGKEQVIADFLNALMTSRGFKIYSPDMEDRAEAAVLMEQGLDYEDALTLQCALANNVDKIMSFDRHFDKIKEIKRIEP